MTHTFPIAAIKPHELTMHGHTRVDNYFWLREKSNPEVIAYLEAENAYTQAGLAHTAELQQTLYQEMVARIQETDSSASVAHGGYFYYTRTEAGQQYPIHCRKQGSLDAPEEILLDENILAQGTDYFKVGVFVPSPDHTLLAYSTDSSGGERYTIFVKNLATGELLPDQIPGTSYWVAWGNDNRTLCYTTQDAAWRDYKLFRHVLGSDPAQDEELFHEPDELYRLAVGKTKDNAYIVMAVTSMETSEMWVLDAHNPGGALRLLQARQKGLRYWVEHRNGRFLIRTNADNSPNYKLVTAPVAAPTQENWQELIPHNPGKLLEGMEVFAEYLAVYGRANALPTLDVYRFVGDALSAPHAVEFPEAVYATRGAENPEFASRTFRFIYTSMTTSDTTVDYDMAQHTWHVVKQEPVLGGYDPAHYETARVWAAAGDGTQIPISLLYKKGMVGNGRNPLLLYGYGSYGASMAPGFDQKRLSLVDRGFIWAIAHIRGGQEMGRHWYEQGKFLHKKNTFTDFIACAEHLIEQQFTSHDRLAIMGRSAGGLLIGAVITMRPDLCHAAIAGVPFVDVVTTILDESLPLSVGEWEEWGNPNEAEFYRYMLSYSPYDNTTPQAYPHLLITAGLNDPRVAYWEPAKWTAKLRQVNTSGNHLYLKTMMGAGHFSSSGRYDYLKDTAFEYAFLLDSVGFEH